MTPEQDRKPPSALAEERAVLGSVILDPQTMPEVSAILKSEYFFLPEHRKVYEALLAIHQDGRPIDAVTLRQELTRRGWLNEIGGVGYIGDLMRSVASAANAGYYAKVVFEHYQKRQVIRIAQEAVNDGLDAGTDAKAIMETMINKASGLLSQGGRGGESETPAHAVRQTISDIIAGKRQAIPWPWPVLSRLTQALLPGTVTLLAGDPGASKSFMLLEAAACWYEQGVPIAVLELEEDRTFHLCRALSQRTGEANFSDAGWVKANSERALGAFNEHRGFLDGFGQVIHECPESDITLRTVTDWVRDRARAGCRIIAVDPVTAAGGTSDRSWDDDRTFMMDVKAVVRDSGATLVLVTHPKKGRKNAIGLDELAGGAAYQRFSQTVLWVEALKVPKDVTIHASMGGLMTVEANRIIHICKSRNGAGCGMGLACKFHGLRLSEHGVIAADERNNERGG